MLDSIRWSASLALRLAMFFVATPSLSVAGTVVGFVVDEDEQGVPGAIVIVCDAEGGSPLHREERRPIAELVMQSASSTLDDWLHATTDHKGEFKLEDVPEGDYRLLAQSWSEVPTPSAPLEVNGLIVHLRGTVEVSVLEEGETLAMIRPLGDETFVYNRGTSNDDWYLVMSRAAPRADPVLMFVGWGGPFLKEAIGYARMPAGRIIVRGLPADSVHYTLFASDSQPGFGAGIADLRNGKIVVSEQNLVTSWGNAIHDPPPTLTPLCEELEDLREARGKNAIYDLLWEGFEDRQSELKRVPALAKWAAVVSIVGPLEREMILPSGTRTCVGDYLSASMYLDLNSSRAR